MEFSEQQENRINKILYEYCHNEEYRKALCEKYDTESYGLSILEIYVLEELLTYGNKNIYKTYTTIDQNQNKLEFYDDFMQRLLTDKDFCKRKLIGLEKLPNNQMFIIGIILKTVAEKNNIEIYDPYNQILNNSEEEFRDTLKNLFLGCLILDIVDTCPIKGMFEQRARGQFSKESKEKIISILRNICPDVKDKIEESVDKIMNVTKRAYFISFNWNIGKTNISFEEVYGKTKSNTKDK